MAGGAEVNSLVGGPRVPPVTAKARICSLLPDSTSGAEHWA